MTTQIETDDHEDPGDRGEERRPDRIYPAALPPSVARARIDEEDDGAVSKTGTRKASRESYASGLIELKHSEYMLWAKVFKALYYLTRLLGVGATAAIPFALSRAPTVAFVCSIVACTANVVDAVFDPAKRYKRFARSTHLLAMIKMKRERTYPSHKEALDVLVATEEGDLAQFTDLSAVLKQIEEKNK